MPDRPASDRMLERLAAYLAEQWEELLRLRGSVLKRSEIEAIHDLRVASRRLRSVLEAMLPLLGTRQVRRLRRPSFPP